MDQNVKGILMFYYSFEPDAVGIFRHDMIKVVSQEVNCCVIVQRSGSGNGL